MGTGKTIHKEPLLTGRKRRNGIETGVQSLPRDGSGGYLLYWPGGPRLKGGVSPVQALVWNVGDPGIETGTVGLCGGVARETPK